MTTQNRRRARNKHASQACHPRMLGIAHHGSMAAFEASILTISSMHTHKNMLPYTTRQVFIRKKQVFMLQKRCIPPWLLGSVYLLRTCIAVDSTRSQHSAVGRAITKRGTAGNCQAVVGSLHGCEDCNYHGRVA